MTLSKKIVLLGHFGVGKTSLVRKFVTNEFSSDYKVTIGVHILKKEVEIDDTTVSFLIWDIEGTKNLNLINKAYLLGSHAFILTYDITRPSTFMNLESEINDLKTAFQDTQIKVVGNKVDLILKKTQDIDESVLAITDYLTSAKTGKKVEQLFNDLALNIK